MRIPTVILAAALMLACAPCVALGADAQATVVRYSVSATITFIDDNVQLIQKAPVGTLITAPELGEHEGCVFVGWVNRETGELWDFDDPISGDLVLVASYRQMEAPEPDGPSADGSQTNSTANPVAKPSAVPKTADETPSPLMPVAVAIPLLALSAALFKRSGQTAE